MLFDGSASFLRATGRVVALGFALAFLSSFGQTFFIALSSPGIREAYGLSHGGFGAIYASATLASGLIMIYAGGVLDRVSVRAYGSVAVAGLAAAALSLSLSSHVALLALSLFALRLFGQGMLAHAALTSTARLESGLRGRAIALSMLGLTLGEGLLPSVGLALIGSVGWRGTWQIVAGALVACLAAGLVARSVRARRTTASAAPPSIPVAPVVPLSRRAILADRRFLAFLPALAAPSAIVTAFFFHQRAIADIAGWPVALLAASIAVFALASVTGGMAAGFLVDRLGALRVSRYHLLPLAAASLVLAIAQTPLAAPVFFGLVGLSAGAANVVASAVLAELFGTAQLGRVRALAAAILVVASATTPALAGLVIDAGAGLAMIGVPAAAWAVAGSLANRALRGRGTA